jgi:hypothetical protein
MKILKVFSFLFLCFSLSCCTGSISEKSDAGSDVADDAGENINDFEEDFEEHAGEDTEKETGEEGYHITVNGYAEGDGTIDNPWDISTAMNHPASVKPGDTIFIHAGTYRGNWDVNLSGTAGNYITIRPYLNDAVVLDGVDADDHHGILHVLGDYLIIRNLRITNSNQVRYSTQPGSLPTDIYTQQNISVYGDHVKIINNIVDNSIGGGIGAGTKATNTEIYGNIVFHGGWQGPDRGHGHGMYFKNESGTKVISNNISFNNFQYPLQVFGTGSPIVGFDINKNITFGDGVLQEGANPEGIFMIGGAIPMEDMLINGNYLYQDQDATNLQLGYADAATNISVSLSDNIISGGYYSVDIQEFNDLDFNGNIVVAGYRCVRMQGATDLSQYNWGNNTYYDTDNDLSFHYNGTTSNFSDWQSDTGLDATSEIIRSLPSNIVKVEPNIYEANRGHIVVFNYEGLESIDVNLSLVLEEGVDYKIYDVENLFGDPVITDTYDGNPVSVPMNLTETTDPIAPVPNIPTHTSIEFGAYLVIANPTF